LALLLEITNRAGNHGWQRGVIEFLVADRTRVEPQWLDSDKVRADPAMVAALKRGAAEP
jgi:hypothetical protein